MAGSDNGVTTTTNVVSTNQEKSENERVDPVGPGVESCSKEVTAETELTGPESKEAKPETSAPAESKPFPSIFGSSSATPFNFTPAAPIKGFTPIFPVENSNGKRSREDDGEESENKKQKNESDKPAPASSFFPTVTWSTPAFSSGVSAFGSNSTQNPFSTFAASFGGSSLGAFGGSSFGTSNSFLNPLKFSAANTAFSSSSGSLVDAFKVENPKTFADVAADKGNSKDNDDEEDGETGGEKAYAPEDEEEEEKIQLAEVNVPTGEEEERILFSTKARLFRQDDNKLWKERGRGALHLNQHLTKENFGRIVMRAEGTYNLLLNAPIFKGMYAAMLSDNSVQIAVFEDNKMQSYLVRVPGGEQQGKTLKKFIVQFSGKEFPDPYLEANKKPRTSQASNGSESKDEKESNGSKDSDSNKKDSPNEIKREAPKTDEKDGETSKSDEPSENKAAPTPTEQGEKPAASCKDNEALP